MSKKSSLGESFKGRFRRFENQYWRPWENFQHFSHDESFKAIRSCKAIKLIKSFSCDDLWNKTEKKCRSRFFSFFEKEIGQWRVGARVWSYFLPFEKIKKKKWNFCERNSRGEKWSESLMRQMVSLLIGLWFFPLPILWWRNRLSEKVSCFFFLLGNLYWG